MIGPLASRQMVRMLAAATVNVSTAKRLLQSLSLSVAGVARRVSFNMSASIPIPTKCRRNRAANNRSFRCGTMHRCRRDSIFFPAISTGPYSSRWPTISAARSLKRRCFSRRCPGPGARLRDLVFRRECLGATLLGQIYSSLLSPLSHFPTSPPFTVLLQISDQTAFTAFLFIVVSSARRVKTRS